ncbi:ankyrin repeat and SAM domain-containing protein 4B isoform 1-T2 [Synchiropus picturatus]
MSRYHKAAIDGKLDMLKEATRKDLNTPDEDGMTPTLLAAFYGHVEALQLICSRGGNANKSDIWGNTPLHHAAANGHVHILSFLVSFDANLFALDNDYHTAMDVAASRDRMDCVQFLDSAASRQTNQNPSRVALLKKEAAKEAERRVKQCEKVKQRHQSKMNKMYRGSDYNGSVSEATASTLLRGGTITGVNEQFSQLIAKEKSGSLTARLKGTFGKLGKKEKGTLPKTGADGNVIFLKPESKVSEKPEFLEVFNEQDEAMIEEEQLSLYDVEETEEPAQGKQSIFNRPGLGGLVFMNKMRLESSEDLPRGENESLGYVVRSTVEEVDEDGSDGNSNLPWEKEDLGLDDDENKDSSALDVFLAAISLPEYSFAFNREHLDLEALMLCSDEDLKGIQIQLGPRKKILDAAGRRKNALGNPGAMKESCL